MSTIPPANRFRRSDDDAGRKRRRMKALLRLMFFSGPKVLLTSRISGTCALVMILLCSPALLFSAMLTLPALIFQSPQQNA